MASCCDPGRETTCTSRVDRSAFERDTSLISSPRAFFELEFQFILLVVVAGEDRLGFRGELYEIDFHRCFADVAADLDQFPPQIPGFGEGAMPAGLLLDLREQ